MPNKLQRHVTHCIWLLNIIYQYILYGIIISNKLKLDLKKKKFTHVWEEKQALSMAAVLKSPKPYSQPLQLPIQNDDVKLDFKSRFISSLLRPLMS